VVTAIREVSVATAVVVTIAMAIVLSGVVTYYPNLMHRSPHREPSHSDGVPYLMTAIALEAVQEEDSFQEVRHGRRVRLEAVPVMEQHEADHRKVVRQVAVGQVAVHLQAVRQLPEEDIQVLISNQATGFIMKGLAMVR
jgi:hypothetical protein